MPIDAAARAEALTPDRSFIVQAPAGSGKTGLLVRRYLRLLGVVQRPESIVAMTFTRKAAAEMKERVQQALREGTDELTQAARDRDRQLEWGLLQDSGRLQIQTIDSLCAVLVRQMPLVSESGGIGQVLEEASELYRLAVRRMLQDLAEGGEHGRQLFVRVALFFDNDVANLEAKVAALLGKRDQWESYPIDAQSPVVSDFQTLLQLAHRELRTVFRERSIVDFTEITRAAITALGTPEQPSDLLYSLDYRIEHLMVDEFQDTSKAQYDLLLALTGQWSDGDGRTLFLVGDPAQSIYRFRAAEVALFLKAWEQQRLGGVRLTPLRLQTNFRSTPEIVAWVNEKLGALMDADAPQEGAVKLEQSFAERTAGHGTPKFIPLLEDSGRAEAERIVEIVRQSGDLGSTAILVRSRAHVEAILPFLRSAGIAYEATEIDALKDQQHVLDVLSLTRALVHLADRISWLACLRAPWCGLTLFDLAALAEKEPNRTIFELLADSAFVYRLSPDGRRRAILFVEAMSAALEQVGRVPLRDLVEQTWLSLGGPSFLSGTNQREDVETFLGLLERFEEGGTIRDFSLLSQRVECLYARPGAGENCVRVMTIHMAKGLEFDTVILPQMGRQTRISDSELLLWTETEDDDGTVRLHVAAQSQRGEVQSNEYQAIKAQLNSREAHEDRRLLYVACTRAVNKLYLLGSTKTKANRTDITRPREGTFLRMLWNDYEKDFQSLLRRQLPVQASLFSAADGTKRTMLRRAVADWRPPQSAPVARWAPELVRSAASARTVTYEWVSGMGRHIGTVVHGLLRRIAEEGSGAWHERRVRELSSLVTGELERLGVAPPDQKAAVQQVIRAITNTIGSKRGQWILQAHDEAYTEWPVQGRVGNKLITGSIDRLFRDRDGSLWIVDYKTSEHQGGQLNSFLAEEVRRYREQMENYGALLAHLFPGRIKLGLYFPLLDAWRDWAFVESVVTAGSVLEPG